MIKCIFLIREVRYWVYLRIFKGAFRLSEVTFTFHSKRLPECEAVDRVGFYVMSLFKASYLFPRDFCIPSCLTLSGVIFKRTRNHGNRVPLTICFAMLSYISYFFYLCAPGPPWTIKLWQCFNTFSRRKQHEPHAQVLRGGKAGVREPHPAGGGLEGGSGAR